MSKKIVDKRLEYNIYRDFQHNKQIKDFKRSRFNFRVGIVSRLLFVILFLIILVRVVSVVRNGSNSNLSFTGFLSFLSTLNTVQINISYTDFLIGGNWGIIDNLRQFFNVFAGVFGVLIWLTSNIVNVLLYIISFIRFVFA